MRWCASRTSPPATPSLPPKSTPRFVEALGCTPDHHTLASLRYDLYLSRPVLRLASGNSAPPQVGLGDFALTAVIAAPPHTGAIHRF